MTSSTHYGSPVVLNPDGSSSILSRRTIGGGDPQGYSEDWLQAHLFKHAEVLPIDQIDHAYERLVPVCRELSTPSGPLDVLYATPEGRLVVAEVKLWRNPEARREVIGQILDYANSLSAWSYEDLQREVSRATKRKGNALFEVVRERFPEVEEARFVDDVTRSLRLGNFLLLIVGDGIREGAASIANFLDRGGNLHFGLGVVEVAIFDMPGGGQIVQPRVLAKTVELRRTVLVLPDSRVLVDIEDEGDGTSGPDEHKEDPNKQECIRFWGGFLDQLRLDDQSQPIPKNGTGMSNRFFSISPSGRSWISAWIGSFGGNAAGVYLTFARGADTDALYEQLKGQQAEIDAEIGLPTVWESKNGKHLVKVDRQFSDVLSLPDRNEIYRYLTDATNRFVNAFRHRLVTLEAQVRRDSA